MEPAIFTGCMPCTLRCRNEPNVHRESQTSKPEGWHGASLSLIIEGNWSTYRAKIVRYLRQIAVITPYAQFAFSFKAEEEKNSMRLLFRCIASSDMCVSVMHLLMHMLNVKTPYISLFLPLFQPLGAQGLTLHGAYNYTSTPLGLVSHRVVPSGYVPFACHACLSFCD